MDLGRVGIWWSGSWRGPAGEDTAAEMEELGYGTLWSSGMYDPGIAPGFERLLAATRSAVVATGIVSIWVNDPAALAAEAAALERRFPGRFLLGIGASHGIVVEPGGQPYVRPYSRVVEFLDAMDAAEAAGGVGGEGAGTGAGGSGPAAPGGRHRVLAALGPRMVALAGGRSLGAHPYFVPVEHTAEARSVLGPGPLLAPELAVVLERDPERARELARQFCSLYLGLPNYAQNLRRLGYKEDDVAGGGSDRLVEAVMVVGDEEAVAARVAEHLAAGADHVCVQVVTGDFGTFPLHEYRSLAPALAGIAGG